MRSARKSRVLVGTAFVALGVALAAGWAVYAGISSRSATGLEVKDGAALSVIPLALSLICVVWGAVLIHRAPRQ